MKRNVSVEEISDGRLYRSDDLVKVGTNGCQGCCDCCRMDALIVLDPWDVYMLQKGTGLPFEKMLNSMVKLDVIDGLIQPVLNMAGGVCPCLGADGRCEIHEFRPGICRLYPLGRSWENGDFSYILQVNECTHCTGSKVKVKKWLGVPNLPRYEDYCREWHHFLKKAQALCDQEDTGNAKESAPGQTAAASRRKGDHAANMRKIVCMQILQKCYLAGFDTEKDFYPQFEEQQKAASLSLGISEPAGSREAGGLYAGGNR